MHLPTAEYSKWGPCQKKPLKARKLSEAWLQSQLLRKVRLDDYNSGLQIGSRPEGATLRNSLPQNKIFYIYIKKKNKFMCLYEYMSHIYV